MEESVEYNNKFEFIMCVDKHHFTCCCGCTLTCGTITIGVIMILGAISYAATQ